MYSLTYQYSKCFIGNKKKYVTHLLNTLLVFSKQYKNEERLGQSFFQLR